MQNILIYTLTIAVLFLSLFYTDSQKQVSSLRFDLNYYLHQNKICNSENIFFDKAIKQLSQEKKNLEIYYKDNCQFDPHGALDNPDYE